MNKAIRRSLSIVLILVIVTGAFYLYIPPQYSIILNMNQTVGENKVDILCIGSSHLYCGIDPIQLYKEKGYAAFDLAGGSMAPWQSYYYMLEACKTQTPKLIIIDTYMIGKVQDMGYYTDSQTVENLLTFPLSMNKIKAVAESEAESKLSLLLVFPYTYDETDSYPGLSCKKIQGKKDYSLGYKYASGVIEHKDISDIAGVTDEMAIHPKNEKYLRMIIEYCNDNEIPLLLTNTPTPCITEEKQRYYNYINDVADEYTIPFINGCLYYDEMGIDYMTDSYDESGHLNYNGVSKYTGWLADYLEKHYDLPDHRNDPDYEPYEEAVKWLEDKLVSEWEKD